MLEKGERGVQQRRNRASRLPLLVLDDLAVVQLEALMKVRNPGLER
jgi:hypothetical protein